MVLVLYFIYPFAMDTVQIRSFMSIAIIFWGLNFLADENRKKGIIEYIIIFKLSSAFIFLSSTFF